MISELSLDVEVIAEAKHGQEALELMRVNMPHIVVTDMNMPVMNGEQFLEAIYRMYSGIRVIVISGYSQFEYMKAALTYQACEYVLKPISITDLRNAMIKAIDASRNYSSLQQQKKFTQDMMKQKREEFLQHVTSQRITNVSDIHTQSDELGLVNVRGLYRLAVCRFRQFREISSNKFHGNADLFMFSMENILSEIMQDDIPLMYKSDDRVSICLIVPESSYDVQRIHDLMVAFHHAVNLILDTDVVVGLSPLFVHLDKLPEAYVAANEELIQNQLSYSGLSISSADFPVTRSTAGILTLFDLKSLGQAFGSDNEKDTRKLLMDFAHVVSKRPATTIRDVQWELGKILEIASSELKGLVSAYPTLFDSKSISSILDLNQLHIFLDQLTDALVAHNLKNGVSESARSIAQIALYLDDHYFEDVSLIDVATRFHMDPIYLSKLFKTVTDENFIEYVTRKRMEKACELLRSSDRKINEISELVGYENQRYFSQVFKKFTDQTPSEYRESHTGEITDDTKY